MTNLRDERGNVNTNFVAYYGVEEYSMRKYNSDMAIAPYTIRLSQELKDEIGRAADEAGLPMNEYIARVLAEHLGQPSLAAIPRKPSGRPRKSVATS